jgi:sulfatase maturation enzyme AslB (radical SAM superfamily)
VLKKNDKTYDIKYTRGKETGEATDFSVTVQDYRDFLCNFFDVWYKEGQPVASAFRCTERPLS